MCALTRVCIDSSNEFSLKWPTCPILLFKYISINKLAFIEAKCLSSFFIMRSVTDCTGNNIFLCKTLIFSSFSASAGWTQKTGWYANWLRTQCGVSFHWSAILWSPDGAFMCTRTKSSGFRLIHLILLSQYSLWHSDSFLLFSWATW